MYLRNIGIGLFMVGFFSMTCNQVASLGTSLWLADWSADAKKSQNMTDRLAQLAATNQTDSLEYTTGASEMNAQRDLRLGIYGLLGIIQGECLVRIHTVSSHPTIKKQYTLGLAILTPCNFDKWIWVRWRGSKKCVMCVCHIPVNRFGFKHLTRVKPSEFDNAGCKFCICYMSGGGFS